MIEFISLGGGAAAGAGGGGGGAPASSSAEGAAQKLTPYAPPSLSTDAQAINRLARSHQDVSIMFMDIVGEQGGGGGAGHTCVGTDTGDGKGNSSTRMSPSCL